MFGAALFVLASNSPAIGQCTYDWRTPLAGMNAGASVKALAVYDEQLIAGGFFSSVGAVPAACVARWNGTIWQPLAAGLSTHPTHQVSALTVYNGELIAGGVFNLGTGAIVNIARWDGTTWRPLGANVGASVTALTVYNNELIAGGAFNVAGGIAANKIAAWNGSTWRALGQTIVGGGMGASGTVLALAVYNGALYAGGTFVQVDGASIASLARWNGTSWQSVGGAGETQPMGGPVRALAVYNNELYVGGSFSQVPTSIQTFGIARWNGSIWQKVGTSGITAPSAATLDSLTVYRNEVIAGGNFLTISGVPAVRAARWDGTTWRAMEAGADQRILAYTTYNGELIAGGDFTMVDNEASPYWARWGPIGAAPFITQQPEDKIVFLGDPVALSVTASGAGTLTYQWRKFGVDLADGAGVTGSSTATLSFSSIEASHFGSYDCVIALNGCNFTISNKAIVDSSTARYVKVGATGNATGTGWANAYPNLQDALAAADGNPAIVELWVAAGTYKPDIGAGINLMDRNAAFRPRNGVAVYGGFAGTETQLGQRNPAVNVTILSGDLQGNDTGDLADSSRAENSFRVIDGTGTDGTAVFDGFVITGGNGTGDTGSGGGVRATGGANPSIRNCNIMGNYGPCAGGLYVEDGSVSLDGIVMNQNALAGGVDSGLTRSTLTLSGQTALSGTLSTYRSTLQGTGSLVLDPTGLLRVRDVGACTADEVIGAHGQVDTTQVYLSIPLSPPLRLWHMPSLTTSFSLEGRQNQWTVAGPCQCSAEVIWTGNMLIADLSTGGRAEATFAGGGQLSITGKVFDVTTSPPVELFDGLLLQAIVGPYRVRETEVNSNLLAFVTDAVLNPEPFGQPRVVPVGGFLYANNLGFRLGGAFRLAVAFRPTLSNLNNFSSSILVSSGPTEMSFNIEALPFGVTEIRSDITGTGDIDIRTGATMILDGGATINLSGLPPGECGNTTNSESWGTIFTNGLFEVRQGAVRSCNIAVNLANFLDGTSIENNDISLTQAGGFGGKFFCGGGATVSCNVIEAEGDRYLDLDPDPNQMPRPTIGFGPTANKITVKIFQGAGLDQGELLELRSVDYDHDEGAGLSGAWPLTTSAGDNEPDGGGYNNAWVLETLEIFPDAKVNLTNRQGFVFHLPCSPQPCVTLPEALYVKKIKMHPGAVLNTGLQRMYYQMLVDENGAALIPDAGVPGSYNLGTRRIVDIPLLGFSLKVIAMEDETEFNVRIRTRVRDANDAQPPAPPFRDGEIVRVIAPIPGSPTNHAMMMRTSKQVCPPASPPCPSASSVAAHGAFARAGEDQIEVKFNYKFCGQPGDELIVYLSDSPDVLSGGAPSPNLVEVARLYPPASGPGSIASNDFAAFSGRFARGNLNFTRGTYVELELRGQDACVLIDDFDPVVCMWCACGDFNGNPCGGVEPIDYLYLLSEYGTGVSEANLCADQMGQDNYVDLSDLMNWSSGFHEPMVLNLCDGTSGAAGGSAGASALPNGLTVAGKPTGNGQNDALYAVNTQTFEAGVAVPAPVQSGGNRTGNGRLVRDTDGTVHQLHGVLGLIRLDTGEVRLAPKTFTNVSLPNVTSGSTVRVGLSTGAGYAMLDAAFDPSDATGNTLFVLPVQVDPPGTNGANCPYRAAAKVQLTGGGNCNLLSVHGLNPAINSTVVSTSIDCSEIVFSPDAARLRELDVDAFGNLFVISAQGVNDNNFVLIYPIEGGSEIRTSLTGQVEAPTALHVYGDHLYVSTSLDGPSTADTVIHRYAITRSGNTATGLDPSPGGHAVFNIPGIRFLTAMTTNTSDGRLYALGFGSLSCSREACNADPNCPLGCHFSTGDPIFTTPMIASITNPTAASPIVTTTAIVSTDPDPGQHLGLPISLAFKGGGGGPICGTGDLDGSGQTSSADIGPFVAALLASTPSSQDLCAGDIDGDNALSGKDIQGFVQTLIGP